MSDQDWKPVVLRGKGKHIDNEKLRKGETKTVSKFDATRSSAMRKLDDSNDIVKPLRINPKISAAIVKNRTKNKLTQKDLAKKINILVPLLQQYENGKVKAEVSILRKMESALPGTKLTGKDFDGINV
jgi:ribosome-binding protein aMBF1 (putative translation factor)